MKKNNRTNKNNRNNSMEKLSGLVFIIVGFLISLLDIKIGEFEFTISCICLGIGCTLLYKNNNKKK